MSDETGREPEPKDEDETTTPAEGDAEPSGDDDTA